MKRKYRFPLLIALSLSLFSALLLLLTQWCFRVELPLGAYALSCGLGFCVSFAVLYLALERRVRNEITAFYRQFDELAKTDTTSSHRRKGKPLKRLTEQIRRIDTLQKLEIKGLRDRETYRREFLGNVAHEMRTPLFTAQSYLLTLMEGAPADKAIRDDYLYRVSKSLDRLIYIIEDLSLIAKLESGSVRVQKQNFNVVKLLGEVVEMTDVKAEKSKNKLGLDKTYTTPIGVFADAKRIEQVLINLVVNAIEHGRKKGHTTLGVEQTKDKVWVSVTDDGEGIAQEHLSRIFERFYRTDKSRARNKGGGSGLGLAIVKHILEAHGEQIKVESEPGSGSRFSFSLAKARM